MRFITVAVIGLVLTGAAAAQQAKAPDSQTTAQQEQQQKTAATLQAFVTKLQGECPGALRAQQEAAGTAMVWTTALGDHNDIAAPPQGLGIHVEFQGAKAAVKELELHVSYLPLGLRRMDVAPAVINAAAPQPQERAKTFQLDREAATRIGGDLLVGPAATITRVHLVSVTYADGTVWNAPGEDACSVVPNRLTMVAAR